VNRPGPARIWILLLIAVWLCGGCTASQWPAVAGSLPRDPVELVQLAEESYSFYGPEKRILLAYEAARRATEFDPSNQRARFLTARTILWLLEFSKDIPNRNALAVVGYHAAEAAIELGEADGPTYFLAGACLGFIVKTSLKPSRSKVKRAYEHFMTAWEVDPGFEQGAPARALGMLLVYAPAWPVSVGDTEGGLEMLEENADTYAQHPANWITLAEAASDTERDAIALDALDKLDQILLVEDWGTPERAWRVKGAKLRREIKERNADG
jgi:hypothetical protein